MKEEEVVTVGKKKGLGEDDIFKVNKLLETAESAEGDLLTLST